MVDPSGGRATLLESIRQAGGIGKAKLRSVKERKLEKKKQKEQKQGAARPAREGSFLLLEPAQWSCSLYARRGQSLGHSNCKSLLRLCQLSRKRAGTWDVFRDGDLAKSCFSRPLRLWITSAVNPHG